ncbi:MAG TPA: DUF2304 domain-containing protein [Puia sp.]|nr:DUF2304 domain-containing protein [Puia sp.]
MKLIQPLLLLALIVIFISYFRWFRSAVFDKILMAIIFCGGILFVILPDFTTKISSSLGVGRGADLLFYIAIISFSYLIMLLYSKIRRLENQIAELVRDQAIAGAKDFSVKKNEDDGK